MVIRRHLVVCGTTLTGPCEAKQQDVRLTLASEETSRLTMAGPDQATHLAGIEDQRGVLLAAGRTHSRHRSNSRTPVSTALGVAMHGQHMGRLNNLRGETRGDAPLLLGCIIEGGGPVPPR